MFKFKKKIRELEKKIKEKLILFLKPKINKNIIDTINTFYMSNIQRLSIYESISFGSAKNKVDIFIERQITVFIFLLVILFLFFKSLWISTILSILYFFSIFLFNIKKIEKKMKVLEYSFPEAIQIFYDNYIISKNINQSLINISKKSKGSIKILFQNLLRKIYSGVEFEKAIDEMASTINIFYAYSFAEILKISQSDAGDITEEISDLLELIQEDIEDREITKSELHENKMIFYVLNIITVIIFITNILVHPYAKELYSYTIKGNAIITFWVIQIFVGITFIELNEKI